MIIIIFVNKSKIQSKYVELVARFAVVYVDSWQYNYIHFKCTIIEFSFRVLT